MGRQKHQRGTGIGWIGSKWPTLGRRAAQLFTLLPLLSAGLLQAQSSFAAATLGSSSSTQTVTVTVTAPGTVQTIKVLTLGAPSLDYQQMGTSTCSGALSTGQTCNVPVQFTPMSPGPRPGAVVLVGTNNTVLATAYLSGTGNGALGIFIPGTASTAAGNGDFTSLGDGGLAIHAGLKLPFGVAVDGAGNIFIADSGEYRIRRVDAQTRDISTYAGDGTESYTGDGGPATSATMGTPVGLTLDGAGNLYFADSTEHVVRRIDAVTKIITSVAGTGTQGSSGDGGLATAALLYAPYGVTVDQNGNLYIADTSNARIRRVDALTHLITTVAGNGTVSATLGDGGPATSASLNQPYGLAFDAGGNLYIADAGNNRIRRVDAGTRVITTVVGTGTQGFAGDSGPPAQAELYFPSSIAFDPAGNLYIADTQNNRIRKVENGNIYTVVGNGAGKYGGDGASALLAGIYGPYFVYFDATGNLYIGDYFDNRIREVRSNVVTLTFPNAIRVGQTAPPQSQGVENDGNAAMIFSSITPDANAAADPTTTSCSTMGSLPSGQGCIVGAEFAPTQVGSPLVGNIVLSGSPLAELGDTPLTIMVVGQALALNTTDVALLNTPNPSTFGQTVSLIATVTTGTGTPTGTVTFKDGTTTLGTGALNGSGTATCSTPTNCGTQALAVGSHSLTAIYAGDSIHSGSTSPAETQRVQSTTATVVTTSGTPSTVNSTVTFTATVTQTSGGTPLSGTAPTGSVIFYDGATTLGPGTFVANGTSGSAGTGTWTFATAALAVGTHTITAAYAGDNYNLASTTASSLTETITKQQTATALASNLNPAYYGNNVTFTATVTVTGTGPATGQVTLLDGATQIGTAVTLNGSGQAVFMTSALTSGLHSLTAHYAGDANNASSVSSALAETVQKATTSDLLASSLTPAIAGKAFTLSATIADTNGAGAATGSVAFANGATSLGSGTLNGSAVASVTPTFGPGTYSLTSTYAGDSNHTGSNGSLSLSVVQATTSVSIVGAPNASTLGQTVSFTIHVTGNGGTPGGTVSLFADGNAVGSATTLTNGGAMVTTSTLAVGTHAMTATYSGDTNDAASSTTSPYTQIVNKSGSTLTVAGSPNPVVAGNTVTFTATVTGTTGNPTPTGMVQFLDGSTSLGTITLSAGKASISTSALTAGQHTITANYGGDADYTGSTGSTTEGVQRSTTATLSANINPAIAGTQVIFTMQVTGTGTTPTGSITLAYGSTTLCICTLTNGSTTYSGSLAAGTYMLTASYAGDVNNGPATSNMVTEQVNQATTHTTISGPSSSIAGKSLTLTGTVSGNGGTPSGNVRFFDGSTLLGTGALNGSGNATLSVSTLTPGSHSLTAMYAGDTNDAASTSAALSENITQAVTNTVLTSSSNPSLVTTSVTLTATVTGNGGTATGNVVFSVGSTTLATVPLPANGIATYSTNALPLGSDVITATYSGDTDDATSQSTLTEVVQQASPTLALSSSLNPSQIGSSVALTATAANTAASITGTVTFMDGNTTLGTAQMGPQKTATLTTSSLAVGTHSITASYAGDADNAAAASAAISQAVQQTSTTQLAASPNPSFAGKAVTLSATVVGANSSAPSGSVTFKDGGTTLGTGTLTAGVATLTTSSLSIGTHTLTAVYSGDTSDAGSTSGPVQELIQSAGTNTVLTSSGSPSLFGANVTFTAQVTGVGAAPSGAVTFTDGSQALGTSTLSGGGQAVFSTNSLAAGQHSIVASYAGDADNQPSQSAALAQVVQAATTTSLVAAPASAIATTAVVLTAQATSNAGTHPGGRITFNDGSTALGTAAVDQNGAATLSVTTLAAGVHSLTAVYAGDAVDAASTSANVAETIQPIPTSSHLGLSASNVLTGQPLTLIAAVTSNYSAPFTGTVTFSTATAKLGQSAVNASGTATLAPVLPAGTYSITASYSGDTFNAPSTSAAVTVTVGQTTDYKITATPSALTMATKQHQVVTVTLSSLDGFTDTVGLGCASLPRLVTCTFSKDVVTLAANGTATVQMTVDTASPLTSGGTALHTSPGSHLPIAFGWLLPGGGLLGWVLCRGRRRWARLLVWLLVATAAGATFSLSGCSGLSSNGAAPGTYTFQVTAYGNATGVQHSVDLSLKVTQ